MPDPAAKPATSVRRGHLLRVLGVGFGLAVTIGNTIGAGILRTPGEVAGHLPNAPLFTLVWIGGGVFALLCANSVAELGTLLPRSGGQYVFAQHTFGNYAGFIVGWSDWLSTCGSTAAVAIIIGEYSGMLFPALAPKARSIAILVVIVFAVLQWRGVRWGSGVQQITSLLKALIFVVLVIACFASSTHAPAALPAALPQGLPLLVAIILSLQAVIYTYDGWTGVIYFSQEVHDPARDIPRSMFGGVLAVIAIYLAINLALLHLIPVSRMAGDDLPLGTAVRMMWGAHADRILEVVVIASMLSAINAFQLMACRILFAMSRDRLFSRVADRVNPGGTPNVALLLSSAAAIFFIASGTFDKVIAVAAFFFVFNYLVSLSAVFVLRRREPARERPFRAWGYPWTTALAWLAALAFLAGMAAGDRRNSLIAASLLLASYPVFRVMRAITTESVSQ